MEATLTLTNFLGPKNFWRISFCHSIWKKQAGRQHCLCHKFLLV